MPASYMNFYVANTVVVVPTTSRDDDRRGPGDLGHVPDPAGDRPARKPVVVGGGAFHCTTQQHPRVPAPSE